MAQVRARHSLCDRCFAALQRPAQSCRRCGQIVAQNTYACGACLQKPCAQRRTLAPFLYTGEIAAQLKALKYALRPHIGRQLAQLIILEVPNLKDLDIDWIVPVPTTQQKIRHRGFNPAGQIARFLARSSKAKFKPRLLIKKEGTPSQVGSTRAQRKQQINGSIKCRYPNLRGNGLPSVHPRILLIDDVITTGSTLNVCAKALNRAGYLHVFALAVAINP